MKKNTTTALVSLGLGMGLVAAFAATVLYVSNDMRWLLPRIGPQTVMVFVQEEARVDPAEGCRGCKWCLPCNDHDLKPRAGQPHRDPCTDDPCANDNDLACHLSPFLRYPAHHLR